MTYTAVVEFRSRSGRLIAKGSVSGPSLQFPCWVNWVGALAVAEVRIGTKSKLYRITVRK